MTTYRVEQDGKVVYEGKSKQYDKDGIPAEWRDRPTSGEVRLYVDDELIGVQISQADEDVMTAAAKAVEGQ
jgi:hypothetical protein